MKIKLTGSKFREHAGKTVKPNYIDDVGDANISGVLPGVDYDWAFSREYEEVYEVETERSMNEEQQFIVTLRVVGVQELAEFLNDLTFEMRDTATLTIN